MNYAKMVLQVIGTIVAGIVAALTGDNHVGNVEWINIAILGVGAAAVFAAPNVRGARYTKFVLSALMAVLVLLVDLIADGVTISEWLQLLVAAMTAVGVYAKANGAREPVYDRPVSPPPSTA